MNFVASYNTSPAMLQRLEAAIRHNASGGAITPESPDARASHGAALIGNFTRSGLQACHLPMGVFMRVRARNKDDSNNAALPCKVTLLSHFRSMLALCGRWHESSVRLARLKRSLKLARLKRSLRMS